MTSPFPAVDPESVERWAVRAVGGHPVDLVGDAGVDGLVATNPDANGVPGRLLVAVKAGSRYDPRMVRDLACAVEALDADSGLLICLSPPPPAVYEAAARTRSSSNAAGGPVVQILTVDEVASGKRPDGTAA